MYQESSFKKKTLEDHSHITACMYP